MKRNRLALLVVGGLVLSALAAIHAGAADKAEADVTKVQGGDLAKFQGTWAVAAASEDGKPAPGPEDLKFNIKDNKMSILVKGMKGEEMSFKLDPSKSPRQIDLSRTVDGKVETAEGIYEVSSDSIKMCLVKPGAGQRPTEFKSANKNTLVLELKRDKP